MPKGWSKGLTKDTDPRVASISRTMKARGVDNFKDWREEGVRTGRIKNAYPPLPKNGDFAELIGVMLGDGHIQRFPRTERLLIFSNANNQGFVDRYANLVRVLFGKEPYVYKTTGKNCIRIGIYEKHISHRLGIPVGARKYQSLPVPDWILADESFVVRYLRGLYEAEGSESHHIPTCTHKFNFANTNESLLENVYTLMQRLGFHLSRDSKRVQISRKAEVKRAVELLQFRKY